MSEKASFTKKKMIPTVPDRLRLAIDALRGRGLRGHHTRHEWIECRCGKITSNFVRDVDERLVDSRLNIKKISLCTSCSMDSHKAGDRCPEAVSIPHRSGACTLGWDHRGRCVPFELPPDVIAELKRQAAEQ